MKFGGRQPKKASITNCILRILCCVELRELSAGTCGQRRSLLTSALIYEILLVAEGSDARVYLHVSIYSEEAFKSKIG